MVTYSADPFRAFADPTRRAVLEYLRGRPHTVNELADYFAVTRPAISKHLRLLKDARVVRERRDGRNRIYELDAAGLNALRDYFDRFWDDALAAFKQAAERGRAAAQHGKRPERSRRRKTQGAAR